MVIDCIFKVALAFGHIQEDSCTFHWPKDLAVINANGRARLFENNDVGSEDSTQEPMALVAHGSDVTNADRNCDSRRLPTTTMRHLHGKDAIGI